MSNFSLQVSGEIRSWTESSPRCFVLAKYNMLYFSSCYNVLLIVQEVFFMKRNGYYNPGWKTTKWYLATKKRITPSKTPSETLPTTFLLRSEPTWDDAAIRSHLPSRKKLCWSYFSLRVLVPPFTQLRRYWYSRPYMAEVKHLQCVNMRALLIISLWSHTS